MKKFSITAMALLLTVFAFAVAQAQKGTIIVTTTQIDVKQGGMVKIGIYNSAGFPTVGKEVAGVDIAVTKASVTYTFKEVPVGQYGIAVFQDKNNDGELSKNLVGSPKEPYGFSKNKYGFFGPPDFDDVSFPVKENKVISLTVNLK